LEKRLRRLTKRAQFLNANKGIYARKHSFALQMVKAMPVINSEKENKPGLGFTITKRTGNSPERSRIKRRLKAASDICAHLFIDRYDYVLIGRTNALTTPFNTLINELEKAIAVLHKQQLSN